ncbi:FAD-dependent oxidoreductase [Caldimonas thermodepolymerans]|uniref:3-(3-hydroxy-phenyl)propionate hydroxylase n=1 Tax=Caldimonas thermodepolymerans TaxID=215580 RepID=A0AA46DB49_9BURK|nr:FAD-dependent oxidoreductase [Caldimonas thermodepolymerans]TCP04173.1 3-(3-hydroxy-phenyl)propionate hydroxylase [Caldimonas thermodepolymerans]UZG47414.1 FAD-dependent oxidoreductase [Caldimonas thermodepolymerans]
MERDDAVDYQALEFAYRRSADQDAQQAVHHPVVIVGAGPVGLSLAIDLAQQGIASVVLDSGSRLSTGSRAICFAKRTLEIWDRLGCGDRMVAKGVSWNVGKVFFRHEQVYQFDLLPERGHERPAFINLQQYYCEGYLVERARQLPQIDLRWRHKVTGLEQDAGGVRLTVETPEGPYALRADYVAACDGSRSTLRQLLGLESKGRVFRDRFLIADIRVPARIAPAERWFWFDPPFHRNQSVLLHMQPDHVWRVDFQLGWDADPEAAKQPENVIPRVRALLGEAQPFELEWVSVYTFSCLRMEKFRHGRVLFAGDAAHLVSPFGARGANSGVQDAENLAWKLAAVLRGQAPDALLDSYASEREYAADENILNSTRSTDFITPKSEVSRLFRDAVLDLSKTHPFARRLVNSGRLSVPAVLKDSPLNTPDAEPFAAGLVPGAPAADAPVRRLADGRDGWLLRELHGSRFVALLFGGGPDAAAQVAALRAGAQGLGPLAVLVVVPRGAAAPDVADAVVLEDREGLLAQRYDGAPGTVYLLRPDQHVCARWRRPDGPALGRAMRRALCLPGG